MKTTARGYGAQHQALRLSWKAYVDTGTVTCWRCGELIATGAAWHLGHDDDDRTKYRGPEHAVCNTRAAGLKAARLKQDPPCRPVTKW